MSMEPMNDHARGCEGREYTCTCGYDAQQAVRLSDAQARIAELEAQLDEALAGNVVPSSIWMRQMELNREAEARTEAAEALLKRLKTVGGAMANACYNISQKTDVSPSDRRDLHFAQLEWDAAARALKEKP